MMNPDSSMASSSSRLHLEMSVEGSAGSRRMPGTLVSRQSLPARRPTAREAMLPISARKLRIGVQLVGDDYANTPPVHALSRRGIVRNLVGFSVFGVTRSATFALAALLLLYGM